MSGRQYEWLADELLEQKVWGRRKKEVLRHAARAIQKLEEENELLRARLDGLEKASGCWNCESAGSCPYSPENGGLERLNCIIRPRRENDRRWGRLVHMPAEPGDTVWIVTKTLEIEEAKVEEMEIEATERGIFVKALVKRQNVPGRTRLFDREVRKRMFHTKEEAQATAEERKRGAANEGMLL